MSSCDYFDKLEYKTENWQTDEYVIITKQVRKINDSISRDRYWHIFERLILGKSFDTFWNTQGSSNKSNYRSSFTFTLIIVSWLWRKDLRNKINIIFKYQSSDDSKILMYQSQEKMTHESLYLLPHYSKNFLFSEYFNYMLKRKQGNYSNQNSQAIFKYHSL